LALARIEFREARGVGAKGGCRSTSRPVALDLLEHDLPTLANAAYELTSQQLRMLSALRRRIADVVLPRSGGRIW